uniref:Outer membrane protein beta-barrel domain-containing protein n=1 Tax=Prevotella sp. GTC17254 TaxID=3236794 RepID=A0AB33IYW5_9BACT
MRHKIILAICLLLTSVGTFAQHAIGVTTIKPYVGLSYAAMFNGDLDFRKGMAVGVDLEKRIAKWFSVSAGAAYAPLGGEYHDSDDKSFIWKHDYLTFPVTANFYPVKGLAFRTGLQAGISIRNRQESIGNNTLMMKEMEGDLKPYDLSIPVAISYELYNIVLDVRWNIGITDVGSSNPWTGNYNMHNSHLGGANFAYVFTIGYQFEL